MKVIRFTNPSDRIAFETVLNNNTVSFSNNIDGDVIYNTGFDTPTAVSVFLNSNPSIASSILEGAPPQAVVVTRILRIKWPHRAYDAILRRGSNMIKPVYDYNANLFLTHELLSWSLFSDFVEDLTDLTEEADYIPLDSFERLAEIREALMPMPDPTSDTPAKKKIVGITLPSPISVALGTGFGSLNLPTTVLCAVRDNPAVNVDVTWLTSEYDRNAPGVYIINGRIQPTNQYYNLGDLKPAITVTVLP